MARGLIHKAMARFDNWVNSVTGQGTSADKTTFGEFHVPNYLTAFDLFEDLYVSDPIFGKIARARPEDAFRSGYSLEGDPTEIERLMNAAALIGSMDIEDPGVDAAVIEGASLANALGGSAILIRTANEIPEEPLRLGDPVIGLTVLSRREIRPEWVVAPSMPESRSRTEFYTLNGIRIHESRVVPFFGEPASRRFRILLGGWGVSKYVKPYRIVSMYMQSILSSGALLSDVAQGVFLIGGLWEMVAQDDTDRADSLSKRMQLYDLNRSSGKALMLDKETEDFKRVATPLTGVPETLRELRAMVAMAADMPETKLFGRSPAGMNATGESDSTNWYDSVDNERRTAIGPRLLRVYQLIADGLGIKRPERINWNALYGMSEKEKAEVAKLRQETVNMAIDTGVLTSDEARIALATAADLYSVINVEEAESVLEENRAPVTLGEKDAPAEMTTKPVEKKVIPLTPTDIAEVVTVDEARASLDLLPLGDGEGSDFIGAFKVRQQARTAAQVAAEYPTVGVVTEAATTVATAPVEPGTTPPTEPTGGAK